MGSPLFENGHANLQINATKRVHEQLMDVARRRCFDTFTSDTWIAVVILWFVSELEFLLVRDSELPVDKTNLFPSYDVSKLPNE